MVFCAWHSSPISFCSFEREGWSKSPQAFIYISKGGRKYFSIKAFFWSNWYKVGETGFRQRFQTGWLLSHTLKNYERFVHAGRPRCPGAIKLGTKLSYPPNWSKMINKTYFWPFGAILDPFGLFWTFLDKTWFFASKTKKCFLAKVIWSK